MEKELTDKAMIESLLNHKHQGFMNDKEILLFLSFYALKKRMHYKTLLNYFELLELR